MRVSISPQNRTYLMRSSPRVVFKSFDFGSNSENFCISQDETKIIDCLNDKIDHLQRKLSNVQNLIVKYEQDKKNKIINQREESVKIIEKDSLNTTFELEEINRKIHLLCHRKKFVQTKKEMKQKNQSKKYIYEGELQEGQFHGRGILINQNFDSQINRNLNLRKVLISQESNFWYRYEGQFKEGKFNGMGTLLLKGKYKINGRFKKGLAEGRMTVIDIKQYANFVNQLFIRIKMVLQGSYQNGKLVIDQ